MKTYRETVDYLIDWALENRRRAYYCDAVAVERDRVELQGAVTLLAFTAGTTVDALTDLIGEAVQDRFAYSV